MVQRQRIRPAAGQPCGTVGGFVIGNHALAAAGVTGQACAGKPGRSRQQPGRDKRRRQRDEAGGVAARHRNPVGPRNRFAPAKLGQAVDPAGCGAVCRRGIQQLDGRVNQRHNLPRGRIGQTEEGKLAAVDRRSAGGRVLAGFAGQGDDLEVIPRGKPVGDPQPGCAGRTVDENPPAHAVAPFRAARASATRARILPTWSSTLALVGPP